jgi:hypothetical protein
MEAFMQVVTVGHLSEADAKYFKEKEEWLDLEHLTDFMALRNFHRERKLDAVFWPGDGPDAVRYAMRSAAALPHLLHAVPSRLGPIVSYFSQEAHEFGGDLIGVLKEYEPPGTQLRRAAVRQMGYCYTFHMLKHIVQGERRLSPEFADVLNRCFICQDCHIPAMTLSGGTEASAKRIYRACQRIGLRDISAVLHAICAVRGAFALAECAMSVDDAAAYCGFHRNTLNRNLLMVLGTHDRRNLRTIGMQGIMTQGLHFMSVDGEFLRTLPVLQLESHRSDIYRISLIEGCGARPWRYGRNW